MLIYQSNRPVLQGEAGTDIVVKIPGGVTVDLADNYNEASEEARVEMYELAVAVETASTATSASFGATVLATTSANVAASVAASTGVGSVTGGASGGAGGAGALALAGQLQTFHLVRPKSQMCKTIHLRSGCMQLEPRTLPGALVD